MSFLVPKQPYHQLLNESRFFQLLQQYHQPHVQEQMEGNMKVAIMTDVMKMDFTERPIPQPKDDEVLVKIEHVGVCGSDLHYFEAGGIATFMFPSICLFLLLT